MKYLVVSDNHGDREILETIATTFADQVDVLLHCGDSELPGNDPLWETFQVVGGNCDFDPLFEDYRIITTTQDTILITHGHRYQVNHSMTSLGLLAQQVNATIVVFGHTHRLGCEQLGERLFLNPGSISQPRGLPYKSFAIIDSTPTHDRVTYYDRTMQPIEGLHFEFVKHKNP
ncbi:metallophosphoesterase [Enterococcus bulliens]